MDTAKQILKDSNANPQDIESYTYVYYNPTLNDYHFKFEEDAQIELVNSLRAISYETEMNFYVEGRAEGRANFIANYGGLLFLGIFLGTLFLIAAVLIIYYKQVSEGYEDKNRYHIMQKVGMSKKEVRSSIRSQVLSIFFLPLLAAGIHIVFPLISKFMMLLNLTNTQLFAVFYSTIYGFTARTYYKIVQ